MAGSLTVWEGEEQHVPSVPETWSDNCSCLRCELSSATERIAEGDKTQAKPLKLDLMLGCSTFSTARPMICHLNLHLHAIFKKWKESDEAE